VAEDIGLRCVVAAMKQPRRVAYAAHSYPVLKQRIYLGQNSLQHRRELIILVVLAGADARQYRVG